MRYKRPSADINLYVICFAPAPLQSSSGSVGRLDFPSDPMWVMVRTGKTMSHSHLFGRDIRGNIEPTFTDELEGTPQVNNKDQFSGLVQKIPTSLTRDFRRSLSASLFTEIVPAERSLTGTPALNGAILLHVDLANQLPFNASQGFPIFLNGNDLRNLARKNKTKAKMDLSETFRHTLRRNWSIRNSTLRLTLSFGTCELDFARRALAHFEKASRDQREACWKKSLSIKYG